METEGKQVQGRNLVWLWHVQWLHRDMEAVVGGGVCVCVNLDCMERFGKDKNM